MRVIPTNLTYEEYEDLVRNTTGRIQALALFVAKHDDSLTKPQVDRLIEISRDIPQEEA